MDIIGKGYEHIKSLCFQCSIIDFYWSCGYLVLIARVLSLLMQIMCLKRLHILQTPTLFQHVGTKLQPCNKLLIKHWNCNKLLICLLKKIMAPFNGWGSTASRLQPLRGGNLLFTIKFPEIPGTNFYQPWKDERLSKPWSHPVALNGTPRFGILCLTTRLLLYYEMLG